MNSLEGRAYVPNDHSHQEKPVAKAQLISIADQESVQMNSVKHFVGIGLVWDQDYFQINRIDSR